MVEIKMRIFFVLLLFLNFYVPVVYNGKWVSKNNQKISNESSKKLDIECYGFMPHYWPIYYLNNKNIKIECPELSINNTSYTCKDTRIRISYEYIFIYNCFLIFFFLKNRKKLIISKNS